MHNALKASLNEHLHIETVDMFCAVLQLLLHKQLRGRIKRSESFINQDNLPTHTQTDRQTDRQIDRWIDR